MVVTNSGVVPAAVAIPFTRRLVLFVTVDSRVANGTEVHSARTILFAAEATLPV